MNYVMEKTMCCPECGSDNLVRSAWVDENNMYIRDKNFSDYRCDNCNDEVTPVDKDEYDNNNT
jgi:transposase-like protein